MILNPSQETAVHECGIQLVLAGPGSGKTRVITEKILHLVEQGILPENILALTFSEKAASEMLERLEGHVDTGHLYVGTFHAFCLEVLQDNVLDSGISFHGGIISRANQLVWGLKNIDSFGFSHIEVGNNAPGVIESIIDGISSFRDELIAPDELAAYLDRKKDVNVPASEREYLDRLSDLLKVYRAYEQYKRTASLLDYDDMIHEAVVLFQAKPQILHRYRQQYTHILVDEFQDTNYAQLQLIRLLAGENVCVVGDDDQTIYRFRGAYLTNFRDFREHYPSCAEILLSHNYRNSQTILTLALELMKHSPSRREKALMTENDPGEPVVVAECENEPAEVEFVLREIRQMLGTPAPGKGRLFTPGDFAVICRRRAEGVKYYRALKHNNIPVEFVGEVEFFEARIIRDILAYLTVLANPLVAGVPLVRIMKMNGVPEIAIQRINTAARELARKTPGTDGVYESMLKAASIVPDEAAIVGEITQLVEKVLAAKDRVTLRELLYDLVMKDTNIFRRALADPEQQEQVLVLTFLQIVEDYEAITPASTIAEFLDYCRLLSGFSVEVGEREESDAVRVLTAHKSKGKEFPVVFVTDMAYGRFPLRYQSKPFYVPNDLSKGVKTGDDEKKLFEQEERRLCYVAMTRAEQRLYFTLAQWYGENKRQTKPSQFLDELRYKNNALIRVEHVPAPVSIAVTEAECPLEQLVRAIREQAKAAIDQGQFHTAVQRLVELEKLDLIEQGNDPSAFNPDTFFSYTEPDLSLVQRAEGKRLPLIGEAHTFSASGLNTFDDCPLRYKFQYVLLVPSRPKTYFSLGSAVHTVVEQLSKDLINGVPFSRDRAIELLNARWDASAYPSKTQELEDRTKAEALLDTFLAWQNNNNNKILAAEQRFKYKLADRTVKGFIDRIEQQPDGGLVVVDFKTGSSAGISKNTIRDDIQMNLYCIAVQSIYGKLPVRASLYYLKEDKMVDYVPDETGIAAFKEKISAMISAVCSEEFVAKPSFMGCERCDYGDLCEVKGTGTGEWQEN